jgi:tetratricopeptide (TPR) repeat protein
MNKKWLISVVLVIVLMPAALPAQLEKDLFEKAKIMLFDRNWEQAAATLERFILEYPNSRNYPMALFYLGKCFEEREDLHKALAAYHDFLKVSRNPDLRDEAAVAVIDLGFKLYQNGDDTQLNEIISQLKSKDRTLRYYAAFKLSYAKDKKVAGRAIPVLKALIAEENEEELVDRAKIALMRIEPELLKDIENGRVREATLMHFEVYDKKSKKITFSLTIPFVFGRLALESIPGNAKSKLRREGYDLDQLVDKLIEKRELVKIEDEDSWVKIWVE